MTTGGPKPPYLFNQRLLGTIQHMPALRWEILHRVNWIEKKRKGKGDRFLLRQGFA
jgi:hypothetical protein